MNEAETRAELIDPELREKGWGTLEGTKVHREYLVAPTKIQIGGIKKKPLCADYVLAYKGRKLAVIEAKSDEEDVSEGVGQAKNYADKLSIRDTYSANGIEIYHIDMETADEGLVESFQTPDELWTKIFPVENKWQNEFNLVPFEDNGGTKNARYYQETAIEKTLDAVANEKNRILLTLATGTGKTFIAFQIAWRLFQTRWNLQFDGKRRPRILFLADRNILANQAFNSFTAFPEDALIRISPKEIRKKGKVPTNGSIFFTIFQTFMSGPNGTPYFGEYPPDFFDFIIIDECHRGGANDESSWRGILEYFSPAVQIGLTATPKRRENVDTYKYFGDPVYIYSLKEGINDGYLTPFKVKKITTSLDQYTYNSEDTVLDGDVEDGRTYTEEDFNKIIEIKAREQKRVQIFMDLINQKEKTLVFCATQLHAAAVRDLINQYKESSDPSYCVRVTAKDGDLGDQSLADFQDNEKSIPTILTTSRKLSTGVDARNVRNIVLMRPVNDIVEFKQIIGRGTRLFEGKEFFTIYDFVNASERFKDHEWDGEPLEPDPPTPKSPKDPDGPNDGGDNGGGEGGTTRPKKIKVKLRDGKELEITHNVATSFWSADGKPITVQEFLNNLYGKLPEFFKSEDELRTIWSNPITRKTLLEKLADAGFTKDDLTTLQSIIDAEKSDLFDVLEFISFSVKPITREDRVEQAKSNIFAMLNKNQREFIEFVLAKYIEVGVDDLDQEKLPSLLELKYKAINDASEKLGSISSIRDLFIEFQKHLYSSRIA